MMLFRTVPFVPLPLSKALRVARKLRLVGLGNRIVHFFPQLSLYLYQTESYLEAREYTTVALFSSVFWVSIIFPIFFVLSLVVTVPANFSIVASLASLLVGLLVFFYIIFYPRVVVTRKVRSLEKNLLFALRHLLIQVRSGVTLFDSLVSVSRAGYGLVSDEFNSAVRRISTGLRDSDALEELALKNPSLYFRRSLWQMSNAIRAGADIANTLEGIILNLANEQRIMVRKYGSQLNPLAFLYMMFGVIMPSLGIALLISLSSFSGLEIQQIYFWAILVFLLIFNFNFLGVIKNKRPSVEVYV